MTKSKLAVLAGFYFVIQFIFTAQLRAQVSPNIHWNRVSDSSIAVYTEGDTLQASSVLKDFAQLRDALAQASIFRVNQTAALKVVAFHSEMDFKQYRLNAGSCAFYQQTDRSDYVVLQDLDASHRDVSAHEFTHFVIAHADVKLPLWLNEGLADFYSTFQVSGDRVIFGRAVGGRLAILRNSEWIPVSGLFQISNDSPYYADPERMLLFYSESWALTHMLLGSPDYSGRFADFIRELNSGRSGDESARLAFGKTPAQMQDDLHAYLNRQHLPLIESHFKSDNPVAPYAMTAVSSSEMDVTLADLMPNNLKTQEAMQTRLASASIKLPDSAGAEESLGYLAFRKGMMSEARQHFAKAVERHSVDPNVLFFLAHLEHEAGTPGTQVIPLLERALALKPDLTDAQLELALVAAGEGDFEKALSNLTKLNVPNPVNAFAAAYTEAYCYAHLEKFTEARAGARRAQSISTRERDRAQVAELLQFIEQQAQER